MKCIKCMCIALLFVFALALTPTAWAQRVVTATITGTVSTGTNCSGGTACAFSVGATNLAGLSYKLVYTFDDSQGTETKSNCSSAYAYDLSYSHIVNSGSSNPGTAVLTIYDSGGNPSEFPFGGGTLGQTSITSYATKYGGLCTGYSYELFDVNVVYGSGGYGGSSDVGPATAADPVPYSNYLGGVSSADWRVPITLAALKSAWTFAFSININLSGHINQYANGYLTPEYLTIGGFDELPAGETTAQRTTGSTPPWNGTYPSTADWAQTLSPADSSHTLGFAGPAKIQEVATGTTVDQCYDNTVSSIFPPASDIPSGAHQWDVDNSNVWKYDTVGRVDSFYLGQYQIAYYRAHSTLIPCSYTNYQQMQYMYSDGSWHNYGSVNTLQGIIGATTITSNRASGSVSKSY